jgi:hypothetical protein
LQRKHKIAVDEDPEAVAYARAHADILKVEELRAHVLHPALRLRWMKSSHTTGHGLDVGAELG